MLVDQLAEGDAHLFLDDARALDMARDLEKLGALVILAPEACEPRRAAAQDRRDDRDAFDIVHRRRTAIKPRARRERRFQARLALIALEALRSAEHTSELQPLMRSSYAGICLQNKIKQRHLTRI